MDLLVSLLLSPRHFSRCFRRVNELFAVSDEYVGALYMDTRMAGSVHVFFFFCSLASVSIGELW